MSDNTQNIYKNDTTKSVGATLPIGISDFQKLILGNYQFADKTLFIKEIMGDGADVILITRPRRFGKTLNLSMLYYFLQNHFSEDVNLFANLEIARDINFCAKHQNKYPVIFISFKDVKASNYEEANDDIHALFSKLYSEHAYLLEGDLLQSHEKEVFKTILHRKSDQTSIKEGISKLSELLQRKFQKNPIILIDEYDTPIQSAYLSNYYDKMIELMRGIFGAGLKDNKYLAKALLTGITRIAQESLFSGLNNMGVYSLLREKYGQYFGFLEEEVIKLKNEIGEAGDNVSMPSIKDWYNGYQIGKYTLYNPWSILNCFDHQGKLGPYWLNTSSNSLIGILLSKAKIDVKYTLEKLLQKEEVIQPISDNLVFPELDTQEEALWSLFLHAGYLNVVSEKLSEDGVLYANISIPNKEVRIVYDKIVRAWFSGAISLDSYDKFVQSLRDGNLVNFKYYLSSYILQSGSYFDFNANTPETVFHSFVLGLVVGLRDNYIINSNHEGGLGRFDVMLMPKNKERNGILLEFKTAPLEDLLVSKAKEALEQIKDKQYFQIFKQHDVTKILAIGVAFCGKKLDLASEEIDIFMSA